LPGITVIASGGSQPLEPGRGLPELVRQPDMREVAGHGDVVGTLAGKIGAQRVEHIGSMLVATPIPPRKVAEHPLAEEHARANTDERRKMQVGQVREHEIGVRRRVRWGVGAVVGIYRQRYGAHAVSI
jgi:hypothetical protein